jgi:glycosyltransferase involved in cell wall biosynthesis
MKPSVCFVSLNNYGVLSGDESMEHVGGAEVQQMHVARGLVERGFPVSFVTFDHGQPDGIEIDGIRIFKAYPRSAGVRYLRFLYPRWTGLCAAMGRANADIYYQRMATSDSGQVVLWCRRNGRKCVYSVANDLDCDPRLPELKAWRERVLYRYALRHADVVVTQTGVQQEALRRHFNRDSVVVRSCCPLLASNAPVGPPPGPPRVLWIGRLVPAKRPELCLQIAEERSSIHFDLVGASNLPSDYAREIQRRGSRLANVTMHGFVPHHLMGSLYQQAWALLCTSTSEGFPNTFLEAWRHGRPVVSTLDPDQSIASRKLGAVVAEPRAMGDALADLMTDADHWLEAASNAFHYVRQYHSVSRAVAAYEQVFTGPAQSESRPGAVPKHGYSQAQAGQPRATTSPHASPPGEVLEGPSVDGRRDGAG